MTSFVRLSVQETFDNIQYFRNSDGSICGSSPIGFGASQKTDSSQESASDSQKANPADEIAFSSVMDAYINKYAKSFSKSSEPDETAEAQAQYIIKSLDKDKDGTLSRNELNDFKNSKLNSNLYKQINDLECQFKIYDINQDGELNVAEITKALGQKCYSSQELGRMAKEFNNYNPANKDDKPIIQASDFI